MNIEEAASVNDEQNEPRDDTRPCLFDGKPRVGCRQANIGRAHEVHPSSNASPVHRRYDGLRASDSGKYARRAQKRRAMLQKNGKKPKARVDFCVCVYVSVCVCVGFCVFYGPFAKYVVDHHPSCLCAGVISEKGLSFPARVAKMVHRQDKTCFVSLSDLKAPARATARSLPERNG